MASVLRAGAPGEDGWVLGCPGETKVSADGSRLLREAYSGQGGVSLVSACRATCEGETLQLPNVRLCRGAPAGRAGFSRATSFLVFSENIPGSKTNEDD